MNREDIIRMAREAELHCHVKLTEHGLIIEDLQYFAALVAAAEREACAKVCDANAEACNNNSMLRDVLAGNAAAIRARGNT